MRLGIRGTAATRLLRSSRPCGGPCRGAGRRVESRYEGNHITIEGVLLQELELAKPREVSVSAFVRETLAREQARRKLAAAAVEYGSFVSSNPEEQGWLRVWDEAGETPALLGKASVAR